MACSLRLWASIVGTGKVNSVLSISDGSSGLRDGLRDGLRHGAADRLRLGNRTNPNSDISWWPLQNKTPRV